MLGVGANIWMPAVLGRVGQPLAGSPSLDMNFAGGSYAGAQLTDLTVVRAQTVTSYAQTSGGTLVPFAANLPRITDQGLLIEESRQNIGIRSQTFNSQINNALLTVNETAIIAPDGTLTGNALTGDGTSNSHSAQNGSGTSSFTSGNVYAFSIYAKAGTGNFVQLTNSSSVSFTQNPFANFNLTTGAVTQTGGTTDFVTAFTQPLANGWWRCVAVFQASGTASNSFVTAQSQTGVDGRLPIFSTALTIYVWGVQCELVATSLAASLFTPYVTSYIPTAAVPVTRNIDSVILTGTPFTNVFNQSVGTMYAEGVVTFSNNGGGATRRFVEIGDGAPNRNVLGIGTTGFARDLVISSSTTFADITSTAFVLPIGAVTRIAGAWDATGTGNVNAAVNGTLGTLDSSVTVPVISGTGKLAIGNDAAGVSSAACFNGYLRRIGLWNTRQLDSFLSSVTYAGSTLDMNFATGVYLGKNLSNITFTRALAAYEDTTSGALTPFGSGVIRVTDKGTLEEESRQNLLLQSQTMDSGTWGKGSGTLTPDAVAAPDGSPTADLFQRTVTTSTILAQNVAKAASAITYTLSIYTKQFSTFNFMSMRVQGAFPFAANLILNFALGTISVADMGTSSGSTGTVQALANGWFRVSLTWLSDATTPVQCLFSAASQSQQVDGTDVVNNSGAYFWGAQLEQASFATSYIPTTTVAITRPADVASMTGTAFSDWYTNAAAGTVYCQFICPPISAAAAEFFFDIATDANNEIFIASNQTTGTCVFQWKVGGTPNSITTAAALTPGVRYKAAAAFTAADFSFYINGAQVGISSTGTLPAVNQLQIGARVGGTLQSNAYAERISYGGARLPNAALLALTAPDPTVITAGATLDLNFVTGVYLGKPLSALPCSRASTAYEDTTTGTLTSFAANTNRITNKGTLVEESRINLAFQSQTFGAQIPTECTINQTATAAPDGNTTGNSITESTTPASAHTVQNGAGNITYATTTTYAFSFYGRAGTGRYLQITPTGATSWGASPPYATFDVLNGAVTQSGGTGLVSSSVVAMGGGWYRCVMTATSGTGATSSAILCTSQTGVDGRAPAYTGTGLVSYIWGQQVEAGSFATSYIPTTTVSVTRAADVVSMTGTSFSDWCQNTTGGLPGTMYWQGIVPTTNLSNQFLALLADSTGNQEIAILVPGSASVVRAAVVNGGSTQALFTSGAVYPAGTRVKCALSWAGSDFAFYINGAQIGVSGSGTVPVVDRFFLGAKENSLQQADTYTERVVYIPARIPNATLVTMTT